LPPLPNAFESISALVTWLEGTRNDLVAPAMSLTGLVELATQALSSDPDCLFARMSGSGASVFGICPTAGAAENMAERIRDERPDWWVVAVETFGS
jgi:4-diphosphocytidyl-2-C-methyl-D-erythritol kinase